MPSRGRTLRSRCISCREQLFFHPCPAQSPTVLSDVIARVALWMWVAGRRWGLVVGSWQLEVGHVCGVGVEVVCRMLQLGVRIGCLEWNVVRCAARADVFLSITGADSRSILFSDEMCMESHNIPICVAQHGVTPGLSLVILSFCLPRIYARLNGLSLNGLRCIINWVPARPKNYK